MEQLVMFSPLARGARRLGLAALALGLAWPLGVLAQPTTAPPPVVVVPVASEAPKEPNGTLDYNDGSFYLRSHHDNIVMTWGGRIQADVYAFAGDRVNHYHRGSNGTGLKPNLFFRRFILETGGIIRKKWFYWVGGNFVPQGLAADQSVYDVQVGVYDGFIGYMPLPNLKFYFGQYNEPFTMENVTSSRWTDLMERSTTVRYLATPYNKADGLTMWGETPNKAFEYQLGVFGGDGQNRANIDDRFDGTVRALVRPFFSRSDALKRAHVGGSMRSGRRDSHFVRYDAPSLNTGGNYTFWSSSYNNGGIDTRIIPSRRQTAAAAELYLPFERWDLKGEFVYLNEERREVSAADRSQSLRGGLFWGYGAYAQLSVWVLGSPRVNGHPAGYYGMTKIPDGTTGAEAPYGLQLVARGEVVRMNYDADKRFGAPGGYDGATRNIDLNSVQFAVNYWMTKHIRLTAQYSWYGFPGTPYNNKSGEPANQAVAPGVRAGAPSANSLHELSFRAGLAL